MSEQEQLISPPVILERARDYVRRGFSVLPLELRGKRPLVTWKEFQSRRPTDEELVSWFTSDASNLGIVTGAISGITVIDCDSGEATRLASKMGLPVSPQVKTGKGWHFYYAYEPGVGNFQKRDDLPGIDLRGDGGYVVAPPSVHESGVVYRWEGESRTLPPLPQWILARQVQVQTSAQVVKMPIARLFEGASEGFRNDSLTRLVGSVAGSTSIEVALQLALLWGMHRCTPPMDPREIQATVRSVYQRERSKQSDLARAGWQPDETPIDDSIIRIRSLEERVTTLYRTGLRRGVSTGWANVDTIFTVRKGEWTAITGMPGHGKSSWLDQLAVNVAKLHDWRFLVFSAENLPHEEHVARLLEKFNNNPFNEGPTTRMTLEQVLEGMKFLDEHFVYLAPPEDKQNVRTLLSLVDSLITQERVDAVIIDPWNELDHSRPATMTETEYISVQLTTMRRFARNRQIHLFVVAHPAKLQKDKSGKYPVPTLYDIAGSAHWRNKADNGIVIHRELSVDSSGDVVDRGISNVIVQKIRFRQVGKIGRATLFYNSITGRFSESKYERIFGS
jgi:replicative DNA helicase